MVFLGLLVTVLELDSDNLILKTGVEYPNPLTVNTKKPFLEEKELVAI